VSSKRRGTSGRPNRLPRAVSADPGPGPATGSSRRIQTGVMIIVLILAAIVVLGADFVINTITGDGGASPRPTATATAVTNLAPAHVGWTAG